MSSPNDPAPLPKTSLATSAMVIWKLRPNVPIIATSSTTTSRSGRSRTYASPSRTWPLALATRRGVDSSSRRMVSRPASTATNDTALARKIQPVPTAAMARPATAGPTMRAELNVALLRLSALGRSSGPTSSTMNDWRTGVSSAEATPSAADSAYTCQSCTTPVTSSSPSARASRPIATCTPMISRSLS